MTMLLSKNDFLPRAEATLARLDGALRDALSHQGTPLVTTLGRAFPKDAPLQPAALAKALCPGPVSHVGLAAVVMRELLEPVDAVLDASLSKATVVTGNAKAPGSLLVTCPLLVLGDLEVDGFLDDCGPDSTIVVLGRCVAKGLRTSGNFLVLGDLVVRDVIQGVYNDESLIVAGNLETRFLDENDHEVACYGELRTEHRFENGRSGEEAASWASAFLMPGLWDIDLGEIDHGEIFERIRRNEPVFTETKKHP
ncbi:hypothetical protein D7Y11_17950 [Corallococcus sp. AB018]|uniref:hypothetical protein n=1 Tax=unclassified Corallococcus TaxID=2685029 RepID=UPI000F89B390|nr:MULTISPECIES: hypothetical protein [unclassified Corallococcus]RUO91799.1 hypothetical protein D7Y11_17950 [Corallococcus sp. AB018]